MKRFHVSSSLLILLLCSLAGVAQQVVATNTNVAVPPLINFSGTLTDTSGKPLTSMIAATFSLYSEQTGGAALWMETQNVTPDSSGHYTVMLGSTSSTGLPANIFVAGEAHWLGVQIEGEAEQPRVLIVSAPYALKAGDAQTLGGLPASAFVLTAPASIGAGATTAEAGTATASGVVSPATSSDVTTTGGTVGTIAAFSTATNIQNSLLSQTGTTAVNVKGILNLPATGTATDSDGKGSQPQNLVASAFNSSTSAAVAQTFQWQAEPAGNDTSSPSGTLNLLFGSGTAKPAETGLHIAGDGQITFAAGQTFPGTGNGTITGIATASGSGLSGGGTSGTLSLKIPSAGVTNAMLVDSTITLNANTASGLTTPGAMTLGSTYTIGLKPCSTNQILEYSGSVWNCSSAGTGTISSVTAGTGLSGGGSSGGVTLTNTGLLSLTAGSGITVGSGQTPTISISSTVPLLSANNTFSGTQTINNVTTITGTNNGGVLQVTNTGASGGNPGVVGTTNSTGASGVKGVASATSGITNGVYGISNSSSGTGVEGNSPYIGVSGQGDGASMEGELDGADAGVWGDTAGPQPYAAILGTADSGYAGAFFNNGNAPAVYAENDVGADNPVLITSGPTGAYCTFDDSADLTCDGYISGEAPADGGARRVSLYSVQSAENWFEDAGSGQLANGSAQVTLDPTFASTVNTGVEYHVFLTPNGDCKGLYVSQKSATSFEVHELGGGSSNVAFDYRIMAKRSGYENVRLADVTAKYQQMEQQQKLRHERMQQRRAARVNGATGANAVSLPLPLTSGAGFTASASPRR